MPRGDRTGPTGMGPMTGRGMGYCTGCDQPGFASSGSRKMGRRGFRRFSTFMGFGRGLGRGYYFNQLTKEETKEYLTEEMNYLKKQMGEIEKRLRELNNEE